MLIDTGHVDLARAREAIAAALAGSSMEEVLFLMMDDGRFWTRSRIEAAIAAAGDPRFTLDAGNLRHLVDRLIAKGRIAKLCHGHYVSQRVVDALYRSNPSFKSLEMQRKVPLIGLLLLEWIETYPTSFKLAAGLGMAVKKIDECLDALRMAGFVRSARVPGPNWRRNSAPLLVFTRCGEGQAERLDRLVAAELAELAEAPQEMAA